MEYKKEIIKILKSFKDGLKSKAENNKKVEFKCIAESIRAGVKEGKTIKYIQIPAVLYKAGKYKVYFVPGTYKDENGNTEKYPFIDMVADKKTIIIGDFRDDFEPDIKIVNSFKIHNKNHIKIIVKAILNYIKEFPTSFIEDLLLIEYLDIIIQKFIDKKDNNANTSIKSQLYSIYTDVLKTNPSNEEIIWDEVYSANSKSIKYISGEYIVYIIFGKQKFLIPDSEKNKTVLVLSNEGNILDSNMFFDAPDCDFVEKLYNIMRILEYHFSYRRKEDPEGIIREWLIHNICYDFRIQRRSTKDVDIDNQDLIKYKKILNMIYFNMLESVRKIKYDSSKDKKIDK